MKFEISEKVINMIITCGIWVILYFVVLFITKKACSKKSEKDWRS